MHLQNWISNHRQQIAKDSGVGTGRIKVDERQKSGRDVFFEQKLPGILIDINAVTLLVLRHCK